MSRLLRNLLVGLGSGLVGAVALTATREVLRKNAPRRFRPGTAVLGTRDLVANTALFSMVARGRRPLTRGVTLGLLAGISALTLPRMLGLGRAARSRILQAETVGLYVFGGLAAAGVAWIARNVHSRRVLDEARARAELVHEHVNVRDSGMIH
ncbi:MAG: hypothetical protein ACXVEE_22045 [Polyangiales bacterium]